MSKNKEPQIESEIINSDSFSRNAMGITGLVHQRKKKGVSNLDVMLYTLEGGEDAFEEEVPDHVFSDMIECELSSSVFSCLVNLGKTEYFNENLKLAIHMDEGRDRIEVSDWLNPEALDHKGERIFDLFGSDGEDFLIRDGSGEKVPTISIAAQLVAHDLCERGLLFSVNWYLARIVQEYFSLRYMQENKVFLMGVLWEQFCQKETNEEDVLKGRKAAEENKIRGEKSGSDRRKKERLDLFMDKIEAIYLKNPDMTERMVFEVAFSQAIPEGTQGHGQFDNYSTEIRSNLPYITRYQELFCKTA